MVYCQHCGTKLEKEDKFCEGCGKSISNYEKVRDKEKEHKKLEEKNRNLKKHSKSLANKKVETPVNKNSDDYKLTTNWPYITNIVILSVISLIILSSQRNYWSLTYAILYSGIILTAGYVLLTGYLSFKDYPTKTIRISVLITIQGVLMIIHHRWVDFIMPLFFIITIGIIMYIIVTLKSKM